jgi:hypothetical protein
MKEILDKLDLIANGLKKTDEKIDNMNSMLNVLSAHTVEMDRNFIRQQIVVHDTAMRIDKVEDELEEVGKKLNHLMTFRPLIQSHDEFSFQDRETERQAVGE